MKSVFGHFSRSVASFPPVNNILPVVFCHIFVNFMKKETSTKSYVIFDHFSRSYEVRQFWMVRRNRNVGKVIPMNEPA